MNITWSIAWRYLRAKRRTNAIQIITGISTFGLAFGTAAIIIILSVFNGFEDLLLSMHDEFNPDLKVSPLRGKWMTITDYELAQLEEIHGIWLISKCVEEMAVFEYNGRQEIGTLKGVDGNYVNVTRIDHYITRGQYIDPGASGYPLLLGLGMSYKLGVNIYDRISQVFVHSIVQKKHSLVSRPIQRVAAEPKGAFRVKSDADYEYVITSLEGAQRLFGRVGQYSSLEIGIYPNVLYKIDDIAKEIEEVLGHRVKVEDQESLQVDSIKVMRIEKWLTFLILLLVIALVALNMIGAIWMIVIDKEKDLSLLSALGASTRFVRQVVIRLGLLICFFGIGLGILIASGFYYLQKKYDLIKMGESALVEGYPMVMKASDMPIVIFMVMLMSVVAVLLPAYRIGRPDYEALKHG